MSIIHLRAILITSSSSRWTMRPLPSPTKRMHFSFVFALQFFCIQSLKPTREFIKITIIFAYKRPLVNCIKHFSSCTSTTSPAMQMALFMCLDFGCVLISSRSVQDLLLLFLFHSTKSSPIVNVVATFSLQFLHLSTTSSSGTSWSSIVLIFSSLFLPRLLAHIGSKCPVPSVPLDIDRI